MKVNYNVTEDALWAMTFAEMAAIRDGRSIARPADVLLGLMLVSDPMFRPGVPCLGAYLLRASCAAPDDLPSLRGLGWDDLPDQPSFGGRLSTGVTELLDDAGRLSRTLGSDYIGCEHLLIGLIAESFDDDVDAWLTEARITEATVLRQWIAVLMRPNP